MVKWQRWKHNTGNALGFPGQVSFLRLVPSATYFPDPGIEAECAITDKAYDMLPMVHKAVLWVEYLSTLIREEDKARGFGRTRRRYRDCLAEAHALIGNAIEMLSERREDVA